jgi:hypothetical protein
MTCDGPAALSGEAVAVGWHRGGPAGVPDAAPAPHHHPAFLATHPERAGSGYRQRLGATPVHPADRDEEAPMA